ncbi:MAG TPA: Ig-like domain repeat protein, partial [Gemmataceae bacterium]|nr:Ig-like domain repeat protein [Gemmataceae bacterium]
MLRSAPRSSYRMQVENLEDRIVLSLAGGTILVANSPLLGGEAPTGIIGVDPNTGAQSLVSTGGMFSLPETVRQGPNQQLYVADYSASGTGAIIGVDPSTGDQRLVATGGDIDGPTALAISNGFLYVGDGADVPNIVEIDLSSGQQRLVTSGGNLSNPVALVPGPDNTLYLADEYAFGGTGAIFSIDLQTGDQTVVTQGGLLSHMIDLGQDTNGDLLAYNAGGSVVRIDPQTGAQNLVASDSTLAGLDGGTVDANQNGTIFVSVLPSDTLPSSILSIDPNSGAEQTVSSGGGLSLVAGLDVFSKVDTTTSIASSVNASMFGQAVTLTATIDSQGASAPTGTVQFQVDGNDVGDPVSVTTADGVTTASFTTTGLAVGSHTVTASYSGDDFLIGSSGTLAGGQAINQASTTAVVVSSANASAFGQNVTFTATINVGDAGAGIPTGTVQFQIDGSDVGAPVNVTTTDGVTSASFSTSSLTVGSHTITASYSGDSNFAGSNGALADGQTVNQASTSLLLVSSGNASVFGQSVTFTATISFDGSGTPTGTVQFQVDGSDVGTPVSITTSDGVALASFSTTSLAVGNHTITASYSGDDSFTSSTINLADGQTVSQASTSLVLASSANPSVLGQAVTFTATISIGDPGAGTPTGTVQFQIDG